MAFSIVPFSGYTSKRSPKFNLLGRATSQCLVRISIELLIDPRKNKRSAKMAIALSLDESLIHGERLRSSNTSTFTDVYRLVRAGASWCFLCNLDSSTSPDLQRKFLNGRYATRSRPAQGAGAACFRRKLPARAMSTAKGLVTVPIGGTDSRLLSLKEDRGSSKCRTID